VVARRYAFSPSQLEVNQGAFAWLASRSSHFGASRVSEGWRGRLGRFSQLVENLINPSEMETQSHAKLARDVERFVGAKLLLGRHVVDRERRGFIIDR
jgi:hypothetical protein